MTSSPPGNTKDNNKNPLAEDELTEAEIVRYQQAMAHGTPEIMANFSLYQGDCRRDFAAKGNGHWAVAWSDLMMTMFILFVVLYVYQMSLFPPTWGEQAGRDRAAAIIGGERTVSTATINDLSPPNGHALASIYDASRQVLKQLNLNHIASVDLVPDKSVRVVLTGDLLFNEDSDFLQEPARRALRQLVPLLALAPYQIQVIGHTDNRIGPASGQNYNWQLSLGRALSVGQFLMTAGGLSHDRFTITGKAGTQPRVANDSAENRRLNRRVEIILAQRRADQPVNFISPIRVIK